MADIQILDSHTLLERLKRGDETALQSLWELYSTLVYSVALRVLKDPADAEDVVQEIFLQLWQKSHKFRSERGTFLAWLVVVTRNRCIDKIRRKQPVDCCDNLDLFASCQDTVRPERRLMYRHAAAVIAQLRKDQRYILELAFFEGLTHSEIVKRTGFPLGTIKSKIRSGLFIVRRELQAPKPKCVEIVNLQSMSSHPACA